MKLEYLSDEKLEQLIWEVEQQELITAPPELLEQIMESIEFPPESCEVKTEQSQIAEYKIREFRRYCFRVSISVAAAIALIFALPELSDSKLLEVPQKQEMIVAEKSFTKGEALDDTGTLMQILGGSNIFNNDDKFQIFKRKKGGS